MNIFSLKRSTYIRVNRLKNFKRTESSAQSQKSYCITRRIKDCFYGKSEDYHMFDIGKVKAGGMSRRTERTSFY